MTTENNKKTTILGGITGKGWMPNQSGNPKGRPKNPFTKLLHEYLDANDEYHKHKIIEELVKLAESTGVRGQIPALKEIWERIEGKVPEKHEIEGGEKLGADFAKGMLQEVARRNQQLIEERRMIEGNYAIEKEENE